MFIIYYFKFIFIKKKERQADPYIWENKTSKNLIEIII